MQAKAAVNSESAPADSHTGLPSPTLPQQGPPPPLDSTEPVPQGEVSRDTPKTVAPSAPAAASPGEGVAGTASHTVSVGSGGDKTKTADEGDEDEGVVADYDHYDDEDIDSALNDLEGILDKDDADVDKNAAAKVVQQLKESHTTASPSTGRPSNSGKTDEEMAHTTPTPTSAQTTGDHSGGNPASVEQVFENPPPTNDLSDGKHASAEQVFENLPPTNDLVDGNPASIENNPATNDLGTGNTASAEQALENLTPTNDLATGNPASAEHIFENLPPTNDLGNVNPASAEKIFENPPPTNDLGTASAEQVFENLPPTNDIKTGNPSSGEQVFENLPPTNDLGTINPASAEQVFENLPPTNDLGINNPASAGHVFETEEVFDKLPPTNDLNNNVPEDQKGATFEDGRTTGEPAKEVFETLTPTSTMSTGDSNSDNTDSGKVADTAQETQEINDGQEETISDKKTVADDDSADADEDEEGDQESEEAEEEEESGEAEDDYEDSGEDEEEQAPSASKAEDEKQEAVIDSSFENPQANSEQPAPEDEKQEESFFSGWFGGSEEKKPEPVEQTNETTEPSLAAETAENTDVSDGGIGDSSFGVGESAGGFIPTMSNEIRFHEPGEMLQGRARKSCLGCADVLLHFLVKDLFAELCTMYIPIILFLSTFLFARISLLHPSLLFLPSPFTSISFSLICIFS